MADPSYPVPDYPPPNDLAGFGTLNITLHNEVVHCDTDPLPYWISWSTELWDLVLKGKSPWATITGEVLTLITADVIMHYRRYSPLVQASYGAQFYVLWLTGYDVPNGAPHAP